MNAPSMQPAERREIAQQVGVVEQYLYQCLTGRKEMRPIEAVRVERECGGRLRRWHLRRRTWHLVWPELVDADGAPPVPEDAPSGESCDA